ncbi:MAG: VWA domain-containing protein [Bacteroidia bacterium]|nr:VWA domain-containing protein [Bacteroidia bacterium]
MDEYNIGMVAVPVEEGGRFDGIIENPFILAAEQPVSTFSVDADGASYSFLKKCITQGLAFNRGAVRIEELINYFPFDYAGPAGNEAVALNAEVGDCPWAEGHKIMRLGMKGMPLSAGDASGSNYVFLVDVSGSMDSEDKIDLLKSGLKALVDVLDPEDRISIITYSGSVKKVLESTPVSEASKIKKAIGKLTAGGSTAGGEAMKMAYEEVRRNFIAGGNNRVIMGTDGDFNVGVTDTDSLLEMVQDYAKTGIYLTVCGFGWGNLNDSMMETISNKGNGTYEYIADADDMVKIFVRETSKFHSVANDCKIQIKFNPEAVAQYRLIGYENRVMTEEDFDNDEKDAAEIGADQTITALYEIIPVEGYAKGDTCADFDFRYKKTLNSPSVPLNLQVREEGLTSGSFDFACSLAAFGMIVRESEYKGTATTGLVKELAGKAASRYDPYEYRKDFISLVETFESKKEEQVGFVNKGEISV